MWNDLLFGWLSNYNKTLLVFLWVQTSLIRFGAACHFQLYTLSFWRISFDFSIFLSLLSLLIKITFYIFIATNIFQRLKTQKYLLFINPTWDFSSWIDLNSFLKIRRMVGKIELSSKIRVEKNQLLPLKYLTIKYRYLIV